MNHLIKFAVGAAIAGAVVVMLIKRRTAGTRIPGWPSAAGLRRAPTRPWISPLEEVTDEHAVWGGGGSGLN